MRHLNRRSTQSGVVLVIGLLLLLIITIVAVASMSSTHMQERMAGNARTQALAFEVASAGASNALHFYLKEREKSGSNTYTSFGGCGATAWPTGSRTDPVQEIIDWEGTPVRLSQWMYCLQPPYPEVGTDEFESPISAQLFVLSRGEVLSSDETVVVARRDIETRIGRPNPVESCSAICIPHCGADDDLKFPTSNIFQVFGEGNPAITTGDNACAANVKDSIRDDRIGNYDGGIAAAQGGGTLGWPWDDAGDVLEFIQALANIAEGKSNADTEENFGWLDWHTTYKDTDWKPKGNDTAFLGSQDPEHFALTYVEGDAVFRGSDSGAGILVVNGTLEWAGTPDFKGLILVTGGSFKVSGGGQGGDPAGSLVVLNLEGDPPDIKFGSIILDLIGGGTAKYRYDCRLLQRLAVDVQDLDPATNNGYLEDEGGKVLDSEGNPIIDPEWDPVHKDPNNWSPAGIWLPSCDSGSGQDDILAIRSWRESLGWRDPELLETSNE